MSDMKQTKDAITATQPTCADKLLLLHLGHVVPPQVWRGHALSIETQTGALSQPLRQPGHVAVTLQVVGVQATGIGDWHGGGGEDVACEAIIGWGGVGVMGSGSG